MTGRAGRYVPALFTALTLASATALAAEISDGNGTVAVVYDETIWTAHHDSAGRPELLCNAEACGGETAACGVSLIEDNAAPLSTAEGREAYRAALGPETLRHARDAGLNPRIATPATIEEVGGKTTVTLSITIDLGDRRTRADYFWLPAGADLVGLSCLVAEDSYNRAEPAFAKLVSNLRLR